jgi:predicted membrane-bound spermidine synthase
MNSKPEVAPIGWQHYVGIFLFSLATLLLELSLTRVLSVALWYHFGFLIISTALLGFGSSGVVFALWRRLREEIPLDRALTVLAILFGVLTIACFWLMQRIPFDPFNVVIDRRQLLFMPLYYLVIATPFFCSGLALALLFTRGTKQINRLYAFDLVGAGVGCAALAIVMPKFGGSGSVVIAATLGMLAAAVFALKHLRILAVVSAVFCVALFALSFAADRVLPINVTTLKNPLPYPPIFTAWNSFSRIDLFERPGNPAKGFPAMRRFVYDAGTAATGSEDLRPNVREYLQKYTDNQDYPSGIAYLGKPKPSVLVIGSGGGAEVLDALHYGARSITAVEINPIINEVVSGSRNDFWGGMFRLPEVKLVTEEGRSFVRRSRETCDAIISVHTISNAAVASGALSLSENYVLTREAFENYFDRLAPDGVIFFTRPESHIGRLFATAREALERRGVTNPAAHFYAYRIPPDDWEKERFGENRPAFEAGFLVKKTPFTVAEQQRMEALLGVGQPPRDAGRPAPESLYSLAAPRSGSLLHTILTTPDLPAFYQTQVRQYEPATDDRPFFNHHTRWSSINWQTFRELFTHKKLGMLMLGDLPVAEISLLVLLAQTTLLAAALIFLPLVRFSREGLNVPQRWHFLLYFAALGFGFITIEMALLSHFTLFLGQPVYTYAAILASLLIFTGIGAHLTGRFTDDPRRALLRIVPLLLVVLQITALGLPLIFGAALGLDLWLRILIAVIVLAPLGILLGMPFPLGLRIVSGEASALVSWAWGVNGFFTVIGTVSTLIFGMAFGFKVVLLVGAAGYVLALLTLTRFHLVQSLISSQTRKPGYET